MAKQKRNQLEIVQSDGSLEDDKRIFCRFALGNVPVRFKDLRIGDKGVVVCKDIGGGGAGLESLHELKPKTPLEMWFDLPDGFGPMHFLGKVVWAKMSGVSLWRLGISFDRPKLMSLSRILRMGTMENN